MIQVIPNSGAVYERGYPEGAPVSLTELGQLFEQPYCNSAFDRSYDFTDAVSRRNGKDHMNMIPRLFQRLSIR